jgi:hypothetical protein
VAVIINTPNLQQSPKTNEFVLFEMPMGMMQPSTSTNGFFGAVSMSAINVASSALETILDFVENDYKTSRQVEK